MRRPGLLVASAQRTLQVALVDAARLLMQNVSSKHGSRTFHDRMPAYGSIEHSEPLLSKTKSRTAVAVLSAVLLLVALAGAIHFVKFNESQASVGTKLLHAPDESLGHVALQQLSASLDRQLEALNQLELKALPSHATAAVPAHLVATAQSHPVASKHDPEGKSESFLADIMGIESPAMQSQHSNLVDSSHREAAAQPNSSSRFLLSPMLVVTILAFLSMLL